MITYYIKSSENLQNGCLVCVSSKAEMTNATDASVKSNLVNPSKTWFLCKNAIISLKKYFKMHIVYYCFVSF